MCLVITVIKWILNTAGDSMKIVISTPPAISMQFIYIVEAIKVWLPGD